MNSFCTLFDSKYLTRGLILYDSLIRHSSQPSALYVLALDDECERHLRDMFRSGNICMCIVSLKELEYCLDLKSVRVGRTWQEYCWTLASQLMHYLLKDCDTLTYLDSDMMFFSDPKIIFDEIAERSIGIIPHRFTAENRERLELNGKFNVSWVTARNNDVGRSCIELWAEQCKEWCYYRHEGGKFADQKYLDEWPALYGDQVCEINNVGAGLAPWNLPNYRITMDGEGNVLVSGVSLVFYHYHEFAQQPSGEILLTKYSLHNTDRDLIYVPYLAEYRRVSERLMLGYV